MEDDGVELSVETNREDAKKRVFRQEKRVNYLSFSVFYDLNCHLKF